MEITLRLESGDAGRDEGEPGNAETEETVDGGGEIGGAGGRHAGTRREMAPRKHADGGRDVRWCVTGRQGRPVVAGMADGGGRGEPSVVKFAVEMAAHEEERRGLGLGHGRERMCEVREKK